MRKLVALFFFLGTALCVAQSLPVPSDVTSVVNGRTLTVTFQLENYADTPARRVVVLVAVTDSDGHSVATETRVLPGELRAHGKKTYKVDIKANEDLHGQVLVTTQSASFNGL